MLLNSIELRGYFTDTFSTNAFPLPSRKIIMCFISFGDRVINYAALCQVPGKLNIKVRVNKGPSAGHDLWHIDQVTVDAILHEAGTGYRADRRKQLFTG